MKSLSDEIEFICPRCSLVRKKTFFSKNNKQEVPSFKSPYFLKQYNEALSGSCLIRCNISKLQIMFKVLVEFIYSQQKKKHYSTKTAVAETSNITFLASVNFLIFFIYKFFLSKILKFLLPFEIKPAPKKQSEKNQMIWDSFLAYLDTIKWRQRS